MEKNINLDKIYTNQNGLSLIRQSINDFIDFSAFEEIIDPCAGAGQFKTAIKEITHQYDIEPETSDIIKQDFFKLNLEPKNRLIICSPPFGKNFYTGRKFLNKCSTNSTAIASIVSGKIELENLIYGFKLIFSKKFEGKCFTREGVDIELPHKFCIWIKN